MIEQLARSVDDVDLLWTSQLDVRFKPGMRPGKPPKVLACYPTWMEGCEPSAREAIEKTATAMASAGAEVALLELPAGYADLPELPYEIQRFETARSYAHEY